MAELFKRGKFYWITDGSGKDRKRIPIGRLSRQTAERIIQEYRDNRALSEWGIPTRPNPIVVKTFLFEYKKHTENISKSSWAQKQIQQIRNFEEFIPGEIFLHEVTVNEIQKYIYSRLDKSPKTIKGEISTFRKMFEYAIVHNYCRTNPCEKVDLPSVGKNPFPPFTQDQLRAVFKHPKYGLYYKTLYYTGLRSSDVSNLHSDTINSDKMCIVLQGTEKTDTPAMIPIHQDIVEIINREGYIFEYEVKDFTPNKYAHSSYLVLKRIVDNNKWDSRLTIHSFRSSFNNRLRDLGVGFEDRKKLLTHSSSKTTMDYTHPNLELARQLIGKM